MTPDRPHYADGTPVPDFIDETTQQYARGTDPRTGAKSVEPAEPVPTVTSLTPSSGPAAGGTAVTVVGDNLGGSTGATVGGAAATGFAVQSETQATFTTPAGIAGAASVVIQNPAGNSAGTTFTYTA